MTRQVDIEVQPQSDDRVLLTVRSESNSIANRASLTLLEARAEKGDMKLPAGQG